MKYTFGMATYDDLAGVVFTAQCLLAFHREHVGEVVVVDNNPTSETGKATAVYCRSADTNELRVRYVPFAEPKGTAAPRNAVFDQAAFPHVVCMDSHVFLLPDAMRQVDEWYTRDEKSADLLQGPMYYNNLQGCETHCEDVWRGQMWGTWARAFMSPTGRMFTYSVRKDGTYQYHDYPTRATLEPDTLGIPELTVYDGPGALIEAGCTHPTEPFPIFSQGLGVFACRKDAWLRFHADAKGFGGEESYIHEKYRQAGRQCWCLPTFSWWHKFDRVGGPAYKTHATVYNKVRNYALELDELKLDREPFRKHFVDEVGLPQHVFDEICAGECAPCKQAAIAAALSRKDEPAAEETPVRTYDDILRVAQGAHVGKLREYAGRVASVLCMTDDPSAVIPLAACEYTVVSGAATPPIAVSLRKVGRKVVYKVLGERVELVYIPASRIDKLRLATNLSTRYLMLAGADCDEHKPALWNFLRANPEWTVIEYPREDGGLCVMSKHPDDKKAIPDWKDKIGTGMQAMYNWIRSGFAGVNEDTLRIRLQTCDVCPSRTDSTCGECGCPIEKKARLGSEKCPLNRW